MELEYVVLLIQGIVLPWLVAIERRLSRIEGYLKARIADNCNGGGYS